MTRSKAPSWGISKDHLPPDVQPHVPDDLEDGQLAFWWAAFAKGVASVGAAQPSYEPDHDYRMPDPVDMLKAAKAEANYGDDPVEATAQDTVARANILMGCARELANRELANGADDETLDRALFRDDAVCKFRDGEGPVDARLIEAMVGHALEQGGVIKGEDW